MDVDHLVRECETRGLLVAPGSEWFPAEPSGPFIRLNFSSENPSRFGEASELLGNALRAVAHLITRFGERTILLTGLINAGVGSLLRATGELVPAIAGSFVLGFALPWIVVAAITTSQRFTPHGLQGRMSAALTFALFAPLPVT